MEKISRIDFKKIKFLAKKGGSLLLVFILLNLVGDSKKEISKDFPQNSKEINNYNNNGIINSAIVENKELLTTEEIKDSTLSIDNQEEIPIEETQKQGSKWKWIREFFSSKKNEDDVQEHKDSKEDENGDTKHPPTTEDSKIEPVVSKNTAIESGFNQDGDSKILLDLLIKNKKINFYGEKIDTKKVEDMANVFLNDLYELAKQNNTDEMKTLSKRIIGNNKSILESLNYINTFRKDYAFVLQTLEDQGFWNDPLFSQNKDLRINLTAIIFYLQENESLKEILGKIPLSETLDQTLVKEKKSINKNKKLKKEEKDFLYIKKILINSNFLIDNLNYPTLLTEKFKEILTKHDELNDIFSVLLKKLNSNKKPKKIQLSGK